jgi:hypothetical protein
MRFAEKLVVASLGGAVVGSAPLEGGAVGRVFAVERRGEGPRRVCVKLVEDRPCPELDDEPAEDRVYGSRPENYHDARALLSSVVPVPCLYSTGVTVDESGRGWRYWVMAQLPGSARLDWRGTWARDATRLHRLAGETLARLHQMERGWPGWIALRETARWRWGPALFEALRRAISQAGENGSLPATVRAPLVAAADQQESSWVDPASFCLSHPDGLQGIFEHDGADWHLRGIVDVEDHFFLDPRFALAGIDLQARLEGVELPSAFRAGYTSIRPWPEGFHRARPVYQMLFLCTWSRVCSASHLAELALEIGRKDVATDRPL